MVAGNACWRVYSSKYASTAALLMPYSPKEWPRLIFSGGREYNVPVNPDGTANDVMLQPAAQCLHQKTGAIHRVAFIIEYNIRV
jgi:hypothetical protein